MIIGTAGHIDHGKTALVRRLTGIDTDRLPEEKRRGMTIDLGFAHLEIPGVGRVGVVDVPGHERFVRNMVAGATGIDLVLLVVAADDGVMPQTLEHLEIVLLLGIPRGLVALNKIDLVDEGRVQTVSDDIRALLGGTTLETAPIVPVSAHTGVGIETLRDRLAGAFQEIRQRGSSGFTRLPLDRVFTKAGHGTVITGTIIGGEVRKGDRLRLLPTGEEVRVRAVQVHNRTVEQAVAGDRCALNLAGVEKASLARGMMLVDRRLSRVSHTADVLLRLSRQVSAPGHGGAAIPAPMPSAHPPRSHQRVHVHAGTAETTGRLLWLGEGLPAPGESAPAQLRFDAALPLLYGDRFIVRDETARHTLGGGIVLDPFASRRNTRGPERRARLERLGMLDPAQSLETWLPAHGAEGWLLPALAEQLAIPPEALEERLAARTDLWRGEVGGSPWIAPRAQVEALLPRLHAALAEYLAAHPRAAAMPPATLRAGVCPRLDLGVFRALVERLIEDGGIERTADGLRPRGHRQRFTAAEQALADRVEATLAFRGRTPPRLEALADAVGRPIPELTRFLAELERAGRVVRIARNVYLTRRDLDAWQARALELVQRHGGMTLAQFRDTIGCGRELAMQVLEYLDHQGVTRRQGNARIAAGTSPRETKPA